MRSPGLYLQVEVGSEVVEVDVDVDVLGDGGSVGTAITTPANSAPLIHGKGGWCWYLPRIWSRSKKLVPAAWMRIRYLVGEGAGVGWVVTVREVGEGR